ncbi:MAG: ATP-binding protein [Cyanobacteria bacterium]|nr:ATP-binding protein [Cyanobacteriota bacterium]
MVRRLSAEDLQHQIEQERLINRITTLVYQSHDLPSILKQTVHELRQFMAIDRLLIYQQQHGMAPTGFGSAVPRGIVCESLAHAEIPSLVELIHAGKLTITAFDHTPSLSFISPDRTPITAELILPIRLQTGIWGLLVAHQCSGDRIWQDEERQGLQQIADNLAIAIYQASLYAELQAEKSSLEEKVLERTQHLRDALFLAQTADRAKSDFLALVSHELRSPLTCVIGMASTLLRQTPERSLPEEKQRAYLQTIYDRGQRLLAIISDMLDLSQLESGQTVLNSSNLVMGDLAAQLLQEFASSAEAKQIRLSLDDHLHYHETTTHGFAADSNRVRQILINLLSNAIKFTPEGGNVVLRLWGNESDIFLQVVDSGMGIPLEYRSVIFEKFQQLDFYRRRSYDGTGLGLALTKQLVELHGGTIEVESSIGKGSTFTVHLPSQIRSAVDYARASRPIRAAEGYGVSQHILLVEQTEELANLVCDFLTPMGYQVTWIADGETAIGHFDAATPALVMVNGTIGESLLLQLKEKAQRMNDPKAKLLILVTEDDRAALEELPQLRPLYFLPLPIGAPEHLIEVVGNLLMNNPEN